MITNEEQERRFKVNEGGLHLLPTILSITLSWFLGTACSGEPVSSAEDAGAMDASHRADAEVLPSCVETGACVTILESGIYSAAGRSWPYDLLRLGKADGSFAYAMWLPPTNQATGPAVLIAAPYAGIDWSGENVDTQWAASAGQPGCYEDVNGPNYQLGVSAPICYGGTQSRQSSGDQAIGFLLNDVGSLIVFGRFYAGSTVTSYIDSMVVGLQFLASTPDVDPERVGVFGISLGGFEALHGAARSPEALIPLVGVGMSPMLDFAEQINYIETFIPGQLESFPDALSNYRDIFDPYVRRTYAATGGPPGPSTDYVAISNEKLKDDLQGEYLIFHDAWDTLVPIGPSETLVSERESIEGFWYPHTSGIDYPNFGIDHQQTSEGQTFSTSLAFTYAFLLPRLLGNDAPKLVVYNWDELLVFFAYIREQQLAGFQIDWLVPRLLELANTSVTAHDVSPSDIGQAPGYHVVGLLLNAIWNAGLDEATFSTSVSVYLQTTGL